MKYFKVFKLDCTPPSLVQPLLTQFPFSDCFLPRYCLSIYFFVANVFLGIPKENKEINE
jgi:hypothetical protein